MRAVMLEVPQALLDERRARGADRWDEMWDGELHMVPLPSSHHQELGAEVFLALARLAQARGLVSRYGAGLFRPGVDNDYRVPDQRVELFANREARMVPVEPVVVECLGVRAETVDGKLRLAWEGGTADF